MAICKVALLLDAETSGIYQDRPHSLLQLSWEILSVHNFYFHYLKNRDFVSAQAIQINQLFEAELNNYGSSLLQVELYIIGPGFCWIKLSDSSQHPFRE